MTEYSIQEKNRAITQLRRVAPSGATLITGVFHRENDGMSRVIGVHAAHITPQGELRLEDIAVYAAILLETELVQVPGIGEGAGVLNVGTGSDHQRDLVETLGQLVWGDPHAYQVHKFA